MKRLQRWLVPIAVCACVCNAADSTNGVPKGWFTAGSHPNEYRMQVDHSITRSGKGSALIRSTVKRPSGFGTLMQTISATDYLGKRIRLSGWVKAEDAKGGGLWLRIDGDRSEMLAFDNMQNRGGINGKHDWKQYDIVLDVPQTSATLNFGILLMYGSLWIDDLKLEIVDTSVPVTSGNSALPKSPANLDFEG